MIKSKLFSRETWKILQFCLCDWILEWSFPRYFRGLIYDSTWKNVNYSSVFLPLQGRGFSYLSKKTVNRLSGKHNVYGKFLVSSNKVSSKKPNTGDFLSLFTCCWPNQVDLKNKARACIKSGFQLLCTRRWLLPGFFWDGRDPCSLIWFSVESNQGKLAQPGTSWVMYWRSLEHYNPFLWFFSFNIVVRV